MKIFSIVILSFITFNCGSPGEVFPVKGTVHRVLPDSMEITIAHDTIQNLMMPMVMPFKVQDLKQVDGLSIGDSVHFEFVLWDTFAFARNFKVVGKGKLPDVQEDDFFEKEEYSSREIGEILDDVSLLTFDSTDVRLSESDGKYRFISFIFTRCPMPNMCPAVVIKNNYLAESFSDHENIDFIMVSFDYIYDTPSVLKKFYGSTILGHNNWQVWSSIGRIDDVYRLVRQSGGDFWGIEEGSIGHTLSSVLIGPDRVVLGLWQGDKWQSGQVKKAIDLLMEK
jgi:protein SCO1/2